MAIRATNTMVEVLQRFLGDLAQAKTLMDADLPFLLELETLIVGKLRDPVRRMEEAGLLPPGQSPQQGGMPGAGGAPGQPPMPGAGGPPMPSPGPSFQGAGMPGLHQMPAAPNADELGRLLNAGQ